MRVRLLRADLFALRCWEIARCAFLSLFLLVLVTPTIHSAPPLSHPTAVVVYNISRRNIRCCLCTSSHRLASQKQSDSWRQHASQTRWPAQQRTPACPFARCSLSHGIAHFALVLHVIFVTKHSLNYHRCSRRRTNCPHHHRRRQSCLHRHRRSHRRSHRLHHHRYCTMH